MYSKYIDSLLRWNRLYRISVGYPSPFFYRLPALSFLFGPKLIRAVFIKKIPALAPIPSKKARLLAPCSHFRGFYWLQFPLKRPDSRLRLSNNAQKKGTENPMRLSFSHAHNRTHKMCMIKNVHTKTEYNL